MSTMEVDVIKTRILYFDAAGHLLSAPVLVDVRRIEPEVRTMKSMQASSHVRNALADIRESLWAIEGTDIQVSDDICAQYDTDVISFTDPYSNKERLKFVRQVMNPAQDVTCIMCSIESYVKDALFEKGLSELVSLTIVPDEATVEHTRELFYSKDLFPYEAVMFHDICHVTGLGSGQVGPDVCRSYLSQTVTLYTDKPEYSGKVLYVFLSSPVSASNITSSDVILVDKETHPDLHNLRDIAKKFSDRVSICDGRAYIKGTD